MFDIGWTVAYYNVWFSTDSNMRRRMLVGIQGIFEMWKHMLKQDDLAPGNEEAIFTRMIDPMAEDPFDLSHIIPAGSGMQILNSLETRLAQPQEVDLDDILLD